MTVVVLLGGPGAGKGTQADDPRRATRASRTSPRATCSGPPCATRSPIGLEARRYMERGQLVPDDITIQMLLDRLTAPDAADGVMLDGFPRNRAQAEALATALAERGSPGRPRGQHRGAHRRARPPPVRPLGLPRRRPRLQRVTPTRPRSRVAATSTARRSSSATDDQPETIRARLTQQLASLRRGRRLLRRGRAAAGRRRRPGRSRASPTTCSPPSPSDAPSGAAGAG